MSSINRKDLLKLYKLKDELLKLTNHHYVFKKNKETIFDLLLIYGNITDINVSHELTYLRTIETRTIVDKELLDKISTKIKHLYELCHNDLLTFKPETDDERFDLMVDKCTSMFIPEYRNKFRTLGLVYCDVLARKRKIVILGNKPLSSFEQLVEELGFEEPSKYFDYTGNIETPIGRND